MRYVSIVPLLIPHLAIEDGELGSYLIPRGTQVCIYSVQNLHNKKSKILFC